MDHQNKRLIYSSSISTVLQKLSTFPHSAFMEECCKSLQDQRQYQTDEDLIYIVQLQHIFEKVDRLSVDYGADLNNPDSSTELYVMALKSELEIFRERIPFDLTESRTRSLPASWSVKPANHLAFRDAIHAISFCSTASLPDKSLQSVQGVGEHESGSMVSLEG